MPSTRDGLKPIVGDSAAETINPFQLQSPLFDNVTQHQTIKLQLSLPRVMNSEPANDCSR